MLQNDKQWLYLDESDVQPSDLLEIHSLTGVSQTSRFVYVRGGRKMIDISMLPMGHYKVYVVSRKGNKHLLGRFCNIIINKM
jgi:hypothetical protein